MIYQSTRDNSLKMHSMDIIKQGISKEGGLFVPVNIPTLKEKDFKEMEEMDYRDKAIKVLSLYLTDYSENELKKSVESAYNEDNFHCGDIAPVVNLGDNLYIQELWHGPTCAFKDMALQILPYLMTTAMSEEDKEIVILVATSGDTGKAALEGFQDVKGTQIIVFYPHNGVSPMQKLQMITQEGQNAHVLAVEGNFDDTQTGVKTIFANPRINRLLAEKGVRFSSANSINWGRLVPQIVYYVSAYVDLIKKEELNYGQDFNLVVPTGNFGNILAAYYAKSMGVPIGKLICASNSNNVLTDFINTGVYDRNREFHKTISPSMDILISSNLERLVYELSGKQDRQVREWMKTLKETGEYRLDSDSLDILQSNFWGGYADEEETLKAIKDTYNNYNYILDPHTAVGKWVYDTYKKETGDRRKTLLVSTASPFKFSKDVVLAILGEDTIKDKDDFEILDILASISKKKIPIELENLKNKPRRHDIICSKESMGDMVIKSLGLDG